MKSTMKIKQRAVLGLSGSAILGLVGAASGAIIYVNDDAPTTNGNGSSWSQAMRHLSDAIALAQPGDQIWVAAGTYYPDTSAANPAGTGDRFVSLQIRNQVQLLGGFAGNESSVSARNPTANVTVLSGDINTRGLHNDNSYNVLEASGANSQGVLDGFTVTRGSADGLTTLDTFAGAGLYVWGGARPTVNNCVFQDNWARAGGAISVNNSSIIVTSSLFQRNTSAVRSGAIEIVASANTVVTDSRFFQNVGPFGGAMYFNNDSTGGQVARCVFEDNDSVNGGAMFLAGFSHTTVRDSLFLRNECKQLGSFQTSFDGGAVKNWCTNSTFINCIFNANRATGTGGALVCGGPSGANATLINCTVFGNWSRDGAAVGAIMGHTPALRNSVVWGNTANGTNPPSINTGVVATNSNVEGLTLVTGGNISIPPQFMGPLGLDGVASTLDDDFRPAPGSPLIDAGNNSSVPAGVTNDYAGNSRFLDGNGDSTATVDIGAIEFIAPPPPPCQGDASRDGVVNFLDISTVLVNFGTDYRPGTGQGDADFSGTVNFTDIAQVLVNFGSTCPN